MEETRDNRIWLRHYEEGVPHTIDYPEQNVYTLLEEAAAKNPGRTATLFFGARLSYARLLELAESFAGALSSLGVKKGDRVALILPNLPAYPIVHFAVLRLGESWFPPTRSTWKESWSGS